ncbi:MAG TPA: glycosyltransferase [Terracidiphilus sp.]|jgi:tetratricopeptide (TPR) repeat protein
MRQTIELSMIVKDGAPVLSRCLRSVASFVDRIVVGDTGSGDESAAIARELGAEVIRIPWEQDFARARNRVLAERKCDWVLVLDADEMLDGAAGARIRELIEAPDVHAYDNWRWNYMKDASMRLGYAPPRPNPVRLEEARAYPAYVPCLTTRLFRGDLGIYYEGCVHETITNRLEALDRRTARADFVIHHFGHAEDAEAEREKKNGLYQALGEKKLQANPDDPQTLFEMGLAILDYARRPAIALGYFERACALNAQLAAGWLFAGVCLVRLGRLPEALERLERTASLGLRNAVFYQTVGDAHFQAARYAEARECYAQVAALGEASPLSEAKLGACEVHMGRVAKGIERMRQAVAEAPAFAELYDILAAGALLGGDLALAAETAEARLRLGETTEFHARLAAILAARMQAQVEAPAVS